MLIVGRKGTSGLIPIFSSFFYTEEKYLGHKVQSGTTTVCSHEMSPKDCYYKLNCNTFTCISRIIVDLKREIWYQKCHDPVCRAENFKSECEYLSITYSNILIYLVRNISNVNSLAFVIGFPLPSNICLPFLFKEVCFFSYCKSVLVCIKSYL